MKLIASERTDPANIEEIGDRVWKIVLPQPFYEPNNIYLLNRGEPVLIDSGYIESLPVLQASLKKLDLTLRDIRHIIYTHPHIDHISAGLVFNRYARATKYGLRGMAFSTGNFMESIQNWQKGVHRIYRKAFEKKEDATKRIARDKRQWTQFFKRFPANQPGAKPNADPVLRIEVELEAEQEVEIGGTRFKMLYTPGHCKTHISPLTDDGLLFSGDLIIGNLTAIYADLDGNLDEYYQTLDKLSATSFERMLPAHGPEIDNPGRRIVLVRKTLKLMERGILRRLRETGHPMDLIELLTASLGEKIHKSGHFTTGLALMDAILSKLCQERLVSFNQAPHGYRRYLYIGPEAD